MLNSEHTPDPQSDPYQTKVIGTTPHQIARAAMEQWTLARWASEGQQIMHSVRNELITGYTLCQVPRLLNNHCSKV